MEKIKVAVLMGGRTPEHEISLISGREVVNNLDKNKYDILPIVISRTGTNWKLVSPNKLLSLPDPLKFKGTNKELVQVGGIEIAGSKGIIDKKVNVVFIAMHGPFGEDGTVQGMLELAGIPYTGPGVLASALGMDKLRFRKILISEKIPIPEFVAVKEGHSLSGVFNKLGDPPYFVKPNDQGSSVGVALVKHKKNLVEALNLAFRYSDIALVDECVQGLEITCGVLGNDKPAPLPLIEIRPRKSEFFDYESKYSESGAEEVVPATVPARLTKKVQKMAIDVYKAIGGRGFSRVDFILRNNKHPVVLEINTIPGLTPMSLFPKAANAAGISYGKLLDKIIKYAIKQ